MRDESPNANHPAHDGRTGITAATASGLKALQPIALFQVSILRMWAHSIERFARNYEKALDETRREASERAHLWDLDIKSPTSGASKPEPLEASP
jgi:hypothetical protein